MKKLLIIACVLAFTVNANAQKYTSKNGHVWFYSKTPIETIEAHNNQTTSIIDASNGTVAFELLIKSFKFESALMEEHFNENYMESEKFPKSTFKGKFVGFDLTNFTKDGTYNVNVEGALTIHGVKKDIKEVGTLVIKGGKITAKSKFKVSPEDYGIAIPTVVKDKISKNLELTVDIKYDLKK